jgi:branched-chain amino acid transport system substrate-binding protein
MGRKLAFMVLGTIAAVLTNTTLARAADDIVIGFATSTSGFMMPYDDNPTKMAQIFIDDVNAKGGLLGRKLKAVFADAKSDRVEGVKAAKDVLRQRADLIFGSCDYDYGSPAVFEAQKAGKISVYICAEDPKAGIAGPNAFTTSAVAQAQGIAMASWGYDKKGIRSAYVLLDDFVEYNKSVCGGFDWRFPQKGGTIVGRDTFKNADPSIASQVTKIREVAASKKIDAIMLCSSPPGGASAMRQIRAAGIDLPVLNGSAMDGTYWLNAVPGLTEFYIPVAVSIFGDDPRKEVASLMDRYKAKFNSTPTTNYGFPVYAFLELWAKAVTKAGSIDAAKVVPVMNSFKDEPTTLGPRTFAPNQHIQMTVPLLIVSISNGTGKVIDQIYEKEQIPREVLYRTGK